MESLWWTVSLLLMGLGLIGAVFPVMPDSLFILAGAFLHHYTVQPAHTVGWWTLGVLTVLCILAHVIDYTAGAMGARKFGGSRWGALGGFTGAIVGAIFFFPLGLVLGPVLGAIGAEVILARRTLGPAARVGWGTFLGWAAGMIGKAVIDLAMVGIFLWQTLHHLA